MTSRNAVVEALLTRLTAGVPATFKTTGRRNRAPESFNSLDVAPALMVLEHSDVYRVESTQLPSIRHISVRLLVYAYAPNENDVPSAIINDLLDAIDVRLQPDDLMTNRCTLGGLVQSVAIDGTIVRSPGDVTGRSLAVVPLTILLP